MKMFLAIFSILLLTGCELDSQENYNASKQYCDMWQIWHESGGEYGWPDQDNKYVSECK